MKKLFLLLLIVSMSLSMTAERVEKHLALKVAETFMPNSEFVDLSKTIDYKNFYIFSTENSFVVVSADDRVMPILAYSDDFPFVTEEMPANISYWMNSLNDEIQYVIDNDIAASKEIESDWDNLKNGVKPEPEQRSFVAPLVVTHWDQNVPYMNMCPGGSVAGCVATAMAQLMKYWEWPHKGEGSHSYEENDYGTISVNFANTIYDWDNMIAKPDATSTQAQQNAVATLTYHCGVSVNMDYSPQGSGAYPSDIEYALETYFDYDTTLHDAYKEYYSDMQWKNMLKSELDAARPVLYSGWDVNGAGHCFVCDGYDENDYFHFNWGWGGYCDGYFAIGLLNPGTGGTGSGSGVYNENNYILVGVVPNVPSISSPSDVVAEVDGHDVTITWTPDEEAHHYKVYRDGLVINNNVTGNSFFENDLPYGTYKYQVRSVKSDGYYSLLSESADAVVSYEGPIPTNVTATQYEGNNVLLTWDAPESENIILKYGDGTPSAYGFGGNYNFYWGQRYTAEQLSEYAGMAMRMFQVYLTKSGTYTLMVYKDINGGLQLQTSKDFNYTGDGSWKIVPLNNPLVIDYSHDMVVMLHNNTVDFPAAYTSYNGSENASLYSFDGINFTTFSGSSWMFRINLSDGTYTYNIYRDGNEIASELTQNDYTDHNLDYGTYEYAVTTNYYCGVSHPSESASVTIADDLMLTVSEMQNPSCEGYADGYIEVKADGGIPPYVYVMGDQVSDATDGSYIFENLGAGEYTIEVSDTYGSHATVTVELIEPDFLEENDNYVKIYPNPTKGIVNIVCDNMKDIKILSVTGQVLGYRDVNDDNVIIDMHDYPYGMYVMVIGKDDGTLIRRNIVYSK